MPFTVLTGEEFLKRPSSKQLGYLKSLMKKAGYYDDLGRLCDDMGSLLPDGMPAAHLLLSRVYVREAIDFLRGTTQQKPAPSVELRELSRDARAKAADAAQEHLGAGTQFAIFSVGLGEPTHAAMICVDSRNVDWVDQDAAMTEFACQALGEDNRPCWVYLFGGASCPFVKVGWSKNVETRRRQLNGQQSPYKVQTMACWPFPNQRVAEGCEADIKATFAAHNVRGEWYRREVWRDIVEFVVARGEEIN